MAIAPEQGPPGSLLLVAPGCPHCSAVLEALSALVKEGVIGTLEVVNIAVHPERAAALGVRGVPWFRIGLFTFEGVHSPAELRGWAERAGAPGGVTAFLRQQLAEGALARAQALLDREPAQLVSLLPLIEAQDSPMQVRIGVGAVLEHFAGSESLHELLPALGRLSQHRDRRVRSDACHYLSLAGDSGATPYLEARLDDQDPEVREIAAESLAAIRQAGGR